MKGNADLALGTKNLTIMRRTLLFIPVFAIVLFSCGQQQHSVETNELIAAKDGYELTEKHFNAYLQFIEEQAGETSNIKTQIAIKSELKQEFLQDPKDFLNELDMLLEENSPEAPMIGIENILANGHRLLRQKLGDDVGQMNFDSASANRLRSYLAGSMLQSSSSTYDGGSGRYSSAKVLFCADGSYVESLSGGLTIDTPGADAYGHDSDTTPGYWEVATLPNNTMLVLLYSNHPNMMEYSTNGFLPMPIQRYTEQVVYLPGGEYYERIANQCTN